MCASDLENYQSRIHEPCPSYTDLHLRQTRGLSMTAFNHISRSTPQETKKIMLDVVRCGIELSAPSVCIARMLRYSNLKQWWFTDTVNSSSWLRAACIKICCPIVIGTCGQCWPAHWHVSVVQLLQLRCDRRSDLWQVLRYAHNRQGCLHAQDFARANAVPGPVSTFHLDSCSVQTDSWVE